MGLLGRTLSKAALQQLRQVVQEEARNEINRILSPAFIASMTAGQQDFEQFFDIVSGYDDELKGVKDSLRVLEKNVENLLKRAGGS